MEASMSDRFDRDEIESVHDVPSEREGDEAAGEGRGEDIPPQVPPVTVREIYDLFKAPVYKNLDAGDL